ncbi:MAG: acyltransferase, partial [Campylobacterales bacterium]|nr:acyltransferase [Campylobacterales bacterium]
SIDLGENLKISGCNIVIKGQNNFLKIGNNVRLRNVFIQIIGENCRIEIGSVSMIGRDSYISAREKNITLKIGERCGISRNAKIMTSDGHPIFQNGIRINDAKNIVIEDDVWIADNVTILKGVTIGIGSVVGINSMVLKDIPRNSVAAGSPCKVIKERDKF